MGLDSIEAGGDRPAGRVIVADLVGRPVAQAEPPATMTTARFVHDLIGYAAAVLTTLAFIPQTLHSWRTRDLTGVSLGMYSLFTVGVGLWLVYGVVLGSWPIIVANAVTLTLAGTVLFLKLRHK